ncbi:exodeoxyribonuclease VII large subunit [Prosthecochloris sp. N3]|uniref:Exodeoxyribonuclease 7 large subunit n=1 Tax=Prosthecochloris ethylica TaxID=2743976 RepID=A0ABR9XNH6_9CHLB|nr:exodeoxyribonuclease VII large subunit [Prosthecochloris ethylica]MBF0585689.1 exodeoxyribonuclease VII large subunit [Prosthecochloris ethylica]MBF0635599.1 exodeoxyribonuclease VII large subunit [Prosthecochloris ethylica]NUK46898.1 exodeoxyribonuclease VII large subunit [Prosthecochloris ethylica]
MDTQSISDLTLQIKNRLESSFPAVSVKGEISNYRRPSSGHVYMTLKDDKAQLPAVLWKSTRSRLSFELRDGLEVVVDGRIEVYPPAGRYQLICSSITPAGEGELQRAFNLLLARLTAAGYFNAEHKQPLPRIPEHIGLITSPTGAVIRDMCDVLGRRFPAARLQLYPVKVQGDGAAESVIEAIDYFTTRIPARERPDVLIVARGGGSLEDLQAFNEESVAMAIFHSSIPVISAIGHETDVTIADMVADVRAGTPSIAAELAVPDRTDMLERLEELTRRPLRSLLSKIEGTERQIDSLTGSYAFNRPQVLCDRVEEQLEHMVRYMRQSAGMKLRHTDQELRSAEEKLHLLDYRTILKRGFTLVRDENGYITRGGGLREGNEATVVFADTSVGVTVTGQRNGNDRADGPARDLHEC